MANSIFLGPNVPQTINGTLTVNGSIVLPGATDSIAFGPAPATAAGSGNAQLRFSNPVSAYFRNAANTTDVSLFFADSSNNIQFGSSANSAETLIKGTNVTRIYTGANSMSWYGTYLRPDADNSYSLGLSTHRWSIAYLGTAAIIGTTPATTGAIRVANAAEAYARNAANSADLRMFQLGISDSIVMGNTTGVVSAQMQAASSIQFFQGATNAISFSSANFAPTPDATLNMGTTVNRWLTAHVSGAVIIGTTPATAGTIRVQHNASASGRNSANSGNLRIWDFGVIANNESRFGDGATNNRICSLLGTPTTLSDGDWWVECTGTTPTRTAILKVRDTGGTRTIATSVAY